MKDSKQLNSTCVCKFRLNETKCEVIMIEPCEHLIHINCINLNKEQVCPLCNVNINGFTKINDYKKDKMLTQKCIDILSMSSVDNIVEKNNLNMLLNTPNFVSLISQFLFTNSEKDVKKICESIFSLAGLTIKIRGINKIKKLEKKVFVSNHVSYFDAIVLYYILGCGFLATDSFKNVSLFKNVINMMPLLFIRHGTKQDTVKRMKDFTQKYKSICVFPEGMFSYPGTLTRFRSGAFQIGEPICPIILKYDKCILDADFINFALKIGSGVKETVEVIFLDPIYPPFNEETPELVRKMMSKTGLLLSRVCANDYSNK